jgi:hypothetical protein
VTEPRIFKMRCLLLPFAALFIATAAPAQEPQWRAASEYDVLLRPWAYEPNPIRLEAGRPVKLRFVNQGQSTHSFAAREFFRAARIRSGASDLADGHFTLAPGERRTIALVPAPGRYRVRSGNIIQRLLGMSAVIIGSPAGVRCSSTWRVILRRIPVIFDEHVETDAVLGHHVAMDNDTSSLLAHEPHLFALMIDADCGHVPPDKPPLSAETRVTKAVGIDVQRRRSGSAQAPDEPAAADDEDEEAEKAYQRPGVGLAGDGRREDDEQTRKEADPCDLGPARPCWMKRKRLWHLLDRYMIDVSDQVFLGQGMTWD